MFNDITLHDSGAYYTLNHNGKTYQCDRVSSIIESTSPTSIYIKKWLVNCGVDLIYPKVRFGPAIDVKELKQLSWSAHQIKSQQALAVGTNVHHMIQRGAYDDSLGCDETRACWAAYQSFTAKHIPVTICSEIALYDTKGLFAGTCDWIGLLASPDGISAQKKAKIKTPQNTIYIIDWKTSKAIHDTYKMQVSVYKHMVKSLIKQYTKSPALCSPQVSRIMNDLILAAGKKPKIVCGIVRMSKNPHARKLFEFVTLTEKQEKAYLKEFALMAKLHNLRQTKEKE